MRIVIDTNVFVSGVYFHGPPYQILEAWRDKKVQVAVSPEILNEYQRVGEILAHNHPDIDLQPVLDFVIRQAAVYTAPPLPETICEDPDDDKFLACALASNSMVVVSGDKHLLDVSGYQEIEILNPRTFVEKFLR